MRNALSAVQDRGLYHQPVLTVTRVCYSMCPRTFARPEFAVYPDGSMVAIDRRPPGDDDSPFRLRAFDLSEPDLAIVANLLQVGRPTTGDVHAAGTRAAVADGGGVVFETAIGSARTYVHAPFFDSPDDDPVRDALVSLLDLFRSYADTADGTPLPLRWVTVGEAAVEPDALPWPSKAVPTGDPPCLQFDPDDLPPGFERLTLQAEHEAAWVSFEVNTYAMTSRLLLPHETGCDDVQSQLIRMFGNDNVLDFGGEG